MAVTRKLKSHYDDAKYKLLSRNFEFDITANYLLFAGPRSGSTWLAEIMREITSAPIIWEPLANKKVPCFNKLGFGFKQFIPQDASWPAAELAFEKLFAGKLINGWTARETNSKELRSARQLLFKICNGIQLMPWLLENFELKTKPVHMIRHPFAVVSSKLRFGAQMAPFLPFTVPNIPFNDIYREHELFLKQIKTREELFLARWCMCNKIPLDHPDNTKNWITISYEELVLEPRKTIGRICSEWGLEVDLDMIDFVKDSSTTRAGSPEEKKTRIDHWKTAFTNDQIERMLVVLDYFNIEAYSRKSYPEIAYNS